MDDPAPRFGAERIEPDSARDRLRAAPCGRLAIRPAWTDERGNDADERRQTDPTRLDGERLPRWMLDDRTPRCDVPEDRATDEDLLETPLFDRAKLDEDGDLRTTRRRDAAEPRPITDRPGREE